MINPKLFLRCFLLPALLLVVTVETAHAVTLGADDFESYIAGSNLHGGAGGTDWSGPWAAHQGATTSHTTVQTKTLVDPNGNVSGGTQAARFQPTSNLGDIGSFLSRPFASTTDTVYVGMLLRAEVMDNGDFIIFQVSNGATGNTTATMGFGLRNQTNNPLFARVGSSGSGQTTNSSTNATANTDFLLVAKFSKDGSANYNRTDLYINPSLTEPAVADATAISGVTGINTLSLFNIRHFNPESGDRIFIDSLNISTTYAEALGIADNVIPEPATCVLGLLGATLLVARRRRVGG